MKKTLLIFLAIFLGGKIYAQTTDQQNLGANTAYQTINSGNDISKQTFKAGLSGKLTSVYIDMEIGSCPLLSNMDVNIDIFDSTGFNLIGNALINFSVPTTRGMHPFNLSSPVYLNANHTYAFVITVPASQICDNPSIAASINWFYGIDDITYSNGTGFHNYSPFGADFYFSTELLVCSNPINGYISAIGYETCQGGNGSVICNTTGGVGPFTYLWNTAATDSALINLASGNYSVMVSDGANCGDHDFYFLPNAGIAVTTHDTTFANSCFSNCNGSASITVLTGVAPYTYTWSNSDTTAIVNGLCSGSYNYTVTDINGCTFSSSVVVGGSPNPIFSTTTITNESCLLGDGAIDLTPSGDFPPFTYLWSDASTTEDLTNLTAGVYQVIITDASGCASNPVDVTVSLNPGATINNFDLDIQNNMCMQTNGHITNLNNAITSSNLPITLQLDASPLSFQGVYNLTAGSYLITATDALGCTDTSLITIQDIGSPIAVMQGSTFTPPCPDACTGTIQVVPVGGSAPYTYNWSNGYTVDYGMNLCAGDYTVVVTDADGCSGTGVMVIVPATPIDVNFSITSPSCGTNEGDATVNIISGGTAPFTFSWSNGDNGSMADSLFAGSYSVMVTDASNCNAFHSVAVSNSSGPTVTESIIHASCFGYSDGAIDLTITGGTPPFQIQWATGHTTEDINSLTAGFYDVSITDASGCMIHKSFEVLENSAITITPTFTLPNCGLSDGDITVVPQGGSAPYSYQWDGGNTTQVVTGLPAGIYEVTITDIAGCQYTFAIGLSNLNAPSINVDQIIYPNCQTGGGNIFITASGGTAPYNYLWNNGITSGDLQNVPEGSYSLNINDSANCQTFQTFDLPGLNMFAQEICMITVDSLTNMNKVIWEKTEGIGISEFRIYRQTFNASFYLLVGIVPFDSLSVFNDTVASTDLRGWKYKLATVDSCGNESDFIASHKTIHLNTEVIGGNDVLLEWDDYIGFSYSEFYINRYHVSNGWEILDTVPASVHSYLDVNAPNGNVGYAITVPSPSDCLPTRVGVNTSRSNIKNQPLSSPASIDENEMSFAIYPNPANDTVNFSLQNYNGGAFTLKIFNAIGEEVISQTMNVSRFEIDTHNIPSGIYTVQISNTENRWVNKLVLNH